MLEQAGERGLDSRTPTWQRDDHIARRRCWATLRRGLSKQALGEEQTALPIGLAALPKGTREAVSHLPVGVAPGNRRDVAGLGCTDSRAGSSLSSVSS